MRRTTIQAEPELLREAQVAAAHEGISLSELVRQGLRMRLERGRPKPSVGGIGQSGTADTSVLASQGRAPAR